MSIVNSVLRVANTGWQIVKQHAPEIAVFTGSAAVLVGGVMACNRTLKAEQLLNEHAARMDIVHQSEEKYDENDYTKNDRLKDKIQVYGETAGKMFRLYAPAIGLATAGFAAIFWGFGLIRARYGMTMTMLAAVEDRFARYRGNVVSEYGHEVDAKMNGSLVSETMELTTYTTDNEGNEVEAGVDNVNVIKVPDVDEQTFVRIFDCDSSRWNADGYLFVENEIKQCNNRIHRDLNIGTNYYKANRVWEAFDVRQDVEGNFYGISKDNYLVCDSYALPAEDRPELIEATPFIKVFADEKDIDINFYQTIIPVETVEQHNHFKQLYIEDDRQVGYLLVLNVDTDENGVAIDLLSKYGY